MITRMTMATFVITIRLFTHADSCVPRMSSSERRSRIAIAGMFMMPRNTGRAMLERRVVPLIRHRCPEKREHLVEVLAPCDGDCCGADGVLEDEIPTDDPRDELTHRHVRVRVRAAGDRNHRRELGIAQARERAADAGDDEREGDRRAGAFGDGRRRSHEQAGADDRADAQCDESPGPECALEPAFRRLRVIGNQSIDRLGPKQ